MMRKIHPGSKVTSPSGIQQKAVEQPQGMTESQVKQIIQGCNAELKQISDITDSLKQEHSQIEKSVSTLQQQIAQINLDYDNVKVDAIHAEKLYTLLKKYHEEIEFIQEAFYYEGTLQSLQCPQLTSIEYMIKEMEKSKTSEHNKQQILHFLHSLSSKIKTNMIYEEKIDQIEKIAQKYSAEFEIMRKVLSTTTFCTNCKELFVPEQNHETACFYHPGKLKYFSCRGCGADDYYTCCLKCSRCCLGCANSAHIP